MDRFGQIGQIWSNWTDLVKLDKFGQIGQISQNVNGSFSSDRVVSYLNLRSDMVYPKLSISRVHIWVSIGKYWRSRGQVALMVNLINQNTEINLSIIYSKRF